VVAELVMNEDHYTRVVERHVRQARHSVWIATANVKDMRMEAPVGTRARARGEYVSIASVLGELAQRGVDVRVLHGARPSGPFRVSQAAAGGRRELLRHCPRMHAKVILVDAAVVYFGSANLTGAGLGAKGHNRRNFEVGMLSTDDVWLDALQAEFARIWEGRACKGCALRRQCPRPIDTLGETLVRARKKVKAP
jgi:phosphatidylserine/phosphatidylglycerophosphate/cardiolipin synthase-like enzyme